MKKTCVFCGKIPKKKNKEHVLPYWLLSLTGDPNRVVKFGFNYSQGKEINFNWNNFTIASCSDCNDKYANFENKVKSIMVKLINKTEIDSNEALELLDWLDKVRIGLWLNYYYLEKNKAQIDPRLTVENRMGKKDRFMQIHFLESDREQQGLNAFGVETFLFQINPACFGLRINNILLINGSNDFIISENCGFPFPKKINSHKNGMLELQEWEYNRNVSKRINGSNLHKGVLTLLQPIQAQVDYKTNFFSDSYLVENCIDNEKRIGTLFRFSEDYVTPVHDFDMKLNYESVKGENVNHIGELISKVYELQNTSLLKLTSRSDKLIDDIIELNKKHIDFYKRLN